MFMTSEIQLALPTNANIPKLKYLSTHLIDICPIYTVFDLCGLHSHQWNCCYFHTVKVDGNQVKL